MPYLNFKHLRIYFPLEKLAFKVKGKSKNANYTAEKTSERCFLYKNDKMKYI